MGTARLPTDVSLLPTSGTFASMAYRVLYKGIEVGQIERVPRDQGGHWRFTGMSTYWGRHFETDEFSEAVDYAVAVARGIQPP
jgi:hypothetical protein